LARYLYGTWIDDVLVMERNGATYFYHHNALGSVVGLTDQARNLVESYEYDPYGEVLSVSSVGNRYLFTGRRLDIETGNYYYRARYYDPEDGRFLQRDPLGFIDGMGLYSYVKNNPIKYIDPQGEALQLAPIGLFVAWCTANVACRTAVLSAITAACYQNTRNPPSAPTIGDIFNNDDNRNSSFPPHIGNNSQADTQGTPPGGPNLDPDDREKPGSKRLVKDAQLPTRGKIRFVPRAADVKNGRITRMDRGYVDKYGNIWKRGPSRTRGQPFEWDVTLSNRGKSQLGHLSRDGKHLNVSLDGRITH
jgi:RHS repeat-associated protein